LIDLCIVKSGYGTDIEAKCTHRDYQICTLQGTVAECRLLYQYLVADKKGLGIVGGKKSRQAFLEFFIVGYDCSCRCHQYFTSITFHQGWHQPFLPLARFDEYGTHGLGIDAGRSPLRQIKHCLQLPGKAKWTDSFLSSVSA